MLSLRREAMETDDSNSSFPRHRRRPLMSQTYTTFHRLLALSRHPAFSSPPQDDNGGGEVGEVHDISDKKCENESIDSVSQDNKTEEEKDLSDTQIKVDIFDSSNVSKEANEEFARNEGNRNDVHCVMGENKVDDQVVEVDSGQNDEKFALALDFCDIDANSHVKELKGDEDILIHEVCESLEMSLNIDMVNELSTCGEDVEETGDEEREQELQRRLMELEMILGGDDMDSTQCVDVGGDIEEGEISGENGGYNGLMDTLFEDDVVEEKKVEEGQVCKDVIDKEKFACEIGQNEKGKCNTPTSLFQSSVDRSNVMIEKKKESTDQACNYDLPARGEYVETRKAKSYDDDFLHDTRGMIRQVGRAMSENAGAGLEDPTPIGTFTSQVAAKAQSYGTDGQDASASEKKRKRGPLTKEKRARKKKKERIKRAEMNRKLGVKRLKIQPLVKPKTVSYCRHYLNGRCQEGENCKFSHDTIPLTKSKPCCHFARQSCMKGDDCPFDHQLSKYPCNNFVTSGFCGRGAGCLFSHKIAANEGSITTSTALETGPKSPTILPNSKKLENTHATTQHNLDAKSYSNGISVAKSTEHNVVVPVQKRTAQPPKGINIFSHGQSSPTEIGKPKLAGQPLSTRDDIKLGHEKVHEADNTKKVSEVERAARKTPKGINFLSFGKAPLNDASGYANSSLLPVTGIGKSILGEQSRNIEIAPSSKTDDSVIVPNLYGQTPSVLPSAAPHGTSVLSFGKVSSDHSSNAQHSISHPSEGVVASAYAHQKNGAPLKFEYPSGVLYRPAFSALPEKSAAENNIGIGSSSKASIFSNIPSSLQKSLQSTLSFAAKFESEMKFNPSISSRSLGTNCDKKAESSENKSAKGLTVLDVLYGDNSKTKS